MNSSQTISRFSYLLWGLIVFFFLLAMTGHSGIRNINLNLISQAEQLFGLEYNDGKRVRMMEHLQNNLEGYREVRAFNFKNDVPPSFKFNPEPAGFKRTKNESNIEFIPNPDIKKPSNPDVLAYLSVEDLASLIHTGRITSVELTRLFLDRIKKYDKDLNSVVTLTENLALRQARQADREIKNGNIRGPLHGIPYGTKDLIFIEGYPTSWGSSEYKNIRADQTAAVIQKLEEAGAVHLAKLSLGSFGWGDMWFEGITRSPWNTNMGSSGSSAGPAAAVSAGLVPFAIGSETLGSLVSPASRNGVTALRPSFGVVSTKGSFAMSWSLDKFGPMTRSVQDAALVFDAIRGPGDFDHDVPDVHFAYGEVDLSQIKIGYVASAFQTPRRGMDAEEQVLLKLESLGAELVPVELPNIPVQPLMPVFYAEAASAVSEKNNYVDNNYTIGRLNHPWPDDFMTAYMVPAVEYIQASRLRSVLIEEMNALYDEVDVIVSPSFEGDNLYMTNFSGNPLAVVPIGLDENGMPMSITFNGRLYDEGTVMNVARAYQNATSHHKVRPPGWVN